MTWLKPDDPQGVAYEFFSPFAHVEGRYEACRIRSPTHGVFDVFIVLSPKGTDHPATVYVRDDDGQSFMRDRYPQCRTIRVAASDLQISESDEGRTVAVQVQAEAGPIRQATLRFSAAADQVPRQVPYGGTGAPVWGNPKLTCWGVDLVLDATLDGSVVKEDGTAEKFQESSGLLTVGSFGRLAPRQPHATR